MVQEWMKPYRNPPTSPISNCWKWILCRNLTGLNKKSDDIGEQP